MHRQAIMTNRAHDRIVGRECAVAWQGRSKAVIGHTVSGVLFTTTIKPNSPPGGFLMEGIP